MDTETAYPKESSITKILSTYKVRQGILLTWDISSIIMAFLISLNLIMERGNIEVEGIYLPLGIYIVFNIASFCICKCYSSLWRYAGEDEMISICIGTLLSIVPIYLIHMVLGIQYPILFYISSTITVTAFTGGMRLAYRTGRRIAQRSRVSSKAARVLVVGAGQAGEMVINEIKQSPREANKLVVGIIDDDINKVGRRLHGVKILGTTNEIEKIVEEQNIDEIILAIANVTKEEKKEILEKCKNTKCKIKKIPGIYEIIDGKVDIKKIKDVEIEDLLGREPIKTDLVEISNYIQNKVVLVTGGGGSIGSELCRQIASFSPKELIILDNYENNAYAIQKELIRKYGKEKLNLRAIIASVREKVRMEEIFKEYTPEVVFHAAAHKHVPLMEDSPSEAIKNNIFGTRNVAELAHKYRAKRMVLISTDKAVNPTNIMGATKRAAEMVIQTMNEESETEFVAVRFGNVLGSNGSVIPLFKKQIEEGGPVTITHPEIIRYFMTIPEAVGLVIQAGAMAKGGEIFVLDMGDPVKIVDLARNLISLSGFEPGVDIRIEYSGLRPGEKLYEELLMSEEGLSKTENEKIFVAKPLDIGRDKVIKNLEMLERIVENEEVEVIDSVMRSFVTTYIKPEEANKVIS